MAKNELKCLVFLFEKIKKILYNIYRKLRKEEIQMDRKYLEEELLEAKANLKKATDNFNNCCDDYFEIANEELTIAERAYNLVLMKMRK